MQAVMNPKYPGLSVRVADEGFDAYVWGNDFSFEVSVYGVPQMGQRVDSVKRSPGMINGIPGG